MTLPRLFVSVFCLVFLSMPAQALESSAGRLVVEPMLDGLDEPWSLAFLDNGHFLVTERGGRLLYVAGGVATPVQGLPRILAFGQGGLMDVLAARDFAQSRTLFFSYARPVGRAVGTAIGKAQLSADGTALLNVQTIFSMLPASETGVHFGGRLVEDAQGRLFLTIGDRGGKMTAQDRATHAGSVIRINPDGTIPADNPFVGNPEILPEIWSYGHRNPQGAALDDQGRLWINEHGARGGDEVNLIRRGANYGWPVITYGRDYDGSTIGIGQRKAGMQQPEHYWDPSIAPSGMMIYSGELWPQWRGQFFIGSLKFDYIARLDPTAGFAEEALQSRETGRVRDIREAPDGSIWFLSVDRGAVYRITPGS